MRGIIAERLSESKFSAPHFYLTVEIDMGNAIDARQAINGVSPVKVSFNDMIIKATSMSLKQYPKLTQAGKQILFATTSTSTLVWQWQ